VERTLRQLRGAAGFTAIPLPASILDFANVLAFSKQGGVLLVQAIDHTEALTELGRVVDSRGLRDWLAAGGKYEVWAWEPRRRAARGDRDVYRRPICAEDLSGSRHWGPKGDHHAANEDNRA
jgi:hypothetical protein